MEDDDGYHTKAIFTRTLQSHGPLDPSMMDSNSEAVREGSQEQARVKSFDLEIRF